MKREIKAKILEIKMVLEVYCLKDLKNLRILTFDREFSVKMLEHFRIGRNVGICCLKTSKKVYMVANIDDSCDIKEI